MHDGQRARRARCLFSGAFPPIRMPIRLLHDRPQAGAAAEMTSLIP